MNSEKKVSELDVEKILFQIWKKVSVEIINRSGEMKTIKRMSKLTQETTISAFENDFFQEIDIFIGHVNCVSHQYEAQRKIKENLPNSHIAVHLDFAEDYSWHCRDEVQTVCFSLTQFPLNHVVVY